MHFSIDEIWLRGFFGPFQVCFVSMCRLIPTWHIITHIGFHNLMSPDLQVSKKVSFKVSKIHLQQHLIQKGTPKQAKKECKVVFMSHHNRFICVSVERFSQTWLQAVFNLPSRGSARLCHIVLA